MDFSSLNLSDIASTPEAPEAGATPAEAPTVSDDIKSQLDKLDPMDIINYLKSSDILPMEFELPSEEGMEAGAGLEGEDMGASIFGDLSLDEVDAPAMAAGGA
jgi:hypothetical protein